MSVEPVMRLADVIEATWNIIHHFVPEAGEASSVRDFLEVKVKDQRQSANFPSPE